MPAHASLALDLSAIEAEPMQVAAFPYGSATLESLMSAQGMTEAAASCTSGCSCCISCCCSSCCG
jgi:hypothetical protein